MAWALKLSILGGALAALRQRAASQGAIARAGVDETETGVVIRTGESVIADRVAEVLVALADEIERGAL
jgi:hypothetical protein